MQVGALRDIKSELAVRRDALQQGIIAQIETQVSPTSHVLLVRRLRASVRHLHILSSSKTLCLSFT